MPKQRELIYHVLLYCHNMQCVGVFSSVGLLETLTRLYLTTIMRALYAVHSYAYMRYDYTKVSGWTF